MKRGRKPGPESALAALWGCSVANISKFKRKGMPIDPPTFEKAQAWKEAKLARGMGYRTAAAPGGTENSPEPLPAGPEATHEPLKAEESGIAGIDMTGLERALAHARAVMNNAYQLVQEAQNARKEALIATRQTQLVAATKEYRQLEAAVRAERERRGQLLSLDQVKVLLGKAWIPTVTALRKLPRTLAIKVNPTDDLHAEKVISEAVEDLIREIRKTLAVELDPEYHFRIWQAHNLREGTVDDLIGKLEATVEFYKEGRSRELADTQRAGAEGPTGIYSGTLPGVEGRSE